MVPKAGKPGMVKVTSVQGHSGSRSTIVAMNSIEDSKLFLFWNENSRVNFYNATMEEDH